MSYTDWQWGRIRARLIVYYLHHKEDLIRRITLRAKIRKQENIGKNAYAKNYADKTHNTKNKADPATKEGQLEFLKIKTNESKSEDGDQENFDDSEEQLHPDNQIKEKRDSDGWLTVAFNILKSDTNNLRDPGSKASIDKEKPDKDWDIKCESLRRYYTGDEAKPSKNTGWLPTRTIPRPRDKNIEKVIFNFLESVGYIDEIDLEEPHNWLVPDKDLMDVMGLSQKELRKSKLPHMLGRDYVSYASVESKTSTALMSVYTKYSHENCQVRYITQEVFRSNQTNQKITNSDTIWYWYWGWLLFDSEDAVVVKVIQENPILTKQYCFWCDKFRADGQKIDGKSKDIDNYSMSAPVEIQASITDHRLLELMRGSYSSNRFSFRVFILSKLKSLTKILNSRRFIDEEKQTSPLMGFKEDLYDDAERLELRVLNERLRDVLNAKIERKILREGKDENMSKDEVYYSDVIIHEEPGERHVMNMSLEEVVKDGLLGERLIQTISMGFPWHIAELIELGADPNFVIKESGGCALHLMALSSANGHLREFTKAVKEKGLELTFNVKTDKGQLPSDIAAEYCVNPEIIEYLFAMEKMEREGNRDFILFEDGDFIKTHGYPLDGIGPEIYDDTDEDIPDGPNL